ncbi:MAG: ComEC/Rec2 family competence protein [Oscillospiraceae bacterium]|nr:ComEC/Rec2 family competence protein [Oscillospiraceae bacterium]
MRKLATAAFSFTIAIFLSHFILPFNGLLICGAIAAASFLLGFLFRGNLRLRIMIILMALAVGFVWSWVFTMVFIEPSRHFHEETMQVTAIVTDFPAPRATRGYRVDVTIRRQDAPDVGARLYYFNAIELNPGDVIAFTAQFRRTEGVQDDVRNDTLSARGTFLTALVSGEITIVESEGQLRFFPRRLSEAIAQRIDEIYPDDIAHFMQALLVGRRDALFRDSALGASLSAAGIIHVVSISGMHVAFLMGLLGFAFKNSRLFAFIGIPVLIFFMAMTGFTPAVTRAGIMQVFLICAPIFKRERDSITSLSAALIVLLSANPYSIASVGLQLSFSATLGIILLTPKINSGVRDAIRDSVLYKKKIPKVFINFIISSLATTTGALVVTIPLTALHFGYVSLIAPLTNLLTLWAVSLAFPIGLISAISSFIFLPLAQIIAYPVTLIARYIIFMARTLGTVPYSIVYSSHSLLMFWLAYIYVIFTSLPLLKARPRQYITPTCVCVVLLFIILLISPLLPGQSDTTLTVLDVGQGFSMVISSTEHTVMIDCGSISAENAGAVAHEYLMSRSRTSVDLLVVTHFHADHVNGIEFLLSRIPISALAIPDPDGSFVAEHIIALARRRGADIIYVTETLYVSMGELSLSLFPPVGFGCINERGVSVLISGEIYALVTGDMNTSTERILVRNKDLPSVDVLIVGHHGSRHSTSEELLHAITPEIAIIPVGRNSFGHPTYEVLERLANHSIVVYRTDLDGRVTVRK